MAAGLEMFWDSPFVSGIAFVPRQTPRPGSESAGVTGSIDVGGAELGWILYERGGSEPAAAEAPVLVYFHANAETAADAAHLAPVYFEAGCAAVLAVDYRGYGWSTGRPSIGTLLADMSVVAGAIPQILAGRQLGGRPLVAYGRSLGAACAVHVVSLAPTQYARLVVDSGLMDIRSLPMVITMAAMMPNGQDLLRVLPDPMGTLEKLSRVACPLLVLHSEADEIVPFAQGQACLRAAASTDKQLRAFAKSGHNDIMLLHREEYSRVLTAFLQGGAAPADEEDAATLGALSVKELRQRIFARGLDVRRCVEKADMVQLLLRDK